ncbi:SixA phosphatase family protein [Aquimarina longa]|uniref:SixA phosphatase family protein n=1 Tax=Aquimarina longa TaxID=1080221 RepID=UPI0009E830CB|nr:histidine phosphatase family protein [Aquimarina longa]
MKTLYMIRHAKSSWEFDLPDIKRPLNEKGLRDAELVGEELKTLIKSLDMVLCSPAERARTTARIITSHLDISEGIFHLEPNLYDFEGSMVIDIIKKCNDQINSLMIFGHNHAFTSIANFFGDKHIDNLPTTGVVVMEFEDDKWSTISVGKTLRVITPKILR